MSRKGVNSKICSLFLGKKAKKRRIYLRTLQYFSVSGGQYFLKQNAKKCLRTKWHLNNAILRLLLRSVISAHGAAYLEMAHVHFAAFMMIGLLDTRAHRHLSSSYDVKCHVLYLQRMNSSQMIHQLGYSVYFILLSCECLYIEFSVFTRAVQAVDIRVDK